MCQSLEKILLTNRRDRPIRPKLDHQINKKHMIEYFIPYDRINRKPDDQIICPVYLDTSLITVTFHLPIYWGLLGSYEMT